MALLNCVFTLYALFMFEQEHARRLSHSLILFPDSGLVSQSPEMLRYRRHKFLSVLVQDSQLVQSRPLVLWKYFWLSQLRWRYNWLAAYNAQAAPTKNDLAPNFHCTEVENSWSAMEIRK